MRSDYLNKNSSSFLAEAGGTHVMKIAATLTDFTDGGSTSGTYAYTAEKLPAGAIVQNSVIHIKRETGASTLTMEIGDGSDADRFNASSDPSLDTVGIVSGGAPQGTALCDAETSITLTVTEGSDFGDVTVLDFDVFLFYFCPGELQTQKDSSF